MSCVRCVRRLPEKLQLPCCGTGRAEYINGSWPALFNGLELIYGTTLQRGQLLQLGMFSLLVSKLGLKLCNRGSMG